MRILYYCEQLYLMGGIERILTLKANELSKRGHIVAFALKHQGSKPVYYPLREEIEVWDLQCPDFSQANSFWTRQLERWEKYRTLKKRLQEVVDAFEPDIIVCPVINHYPILSEIKGSFKTVLEFHASAKSAKRTDPLFNRLMEYTPIRWFCRYVLRKPSSWWRVAYRYYDKFVVLTYEDQREWGEDKCIVIPNVIPYKVVKASTLSSNIVLAVGRFSFQKDFSSLVDIWSMIASKHPTWTLRIVGDGELKQELEDKIKTLGLNTRVELVPATKDILPYYLDASIYALTSKFEGMPMALLEAQSLGLPIVSYTCSCGPRDIITDEEDGFLIPQGDKEIFAQRLSLLIEDETMRRRMGEAALISSKRYTPENIIPQWETMFNTLLEQ